jgi:hypothetical protein
MELDDLKQKWAEYDAKLEKSIRLNTQLLRDSGLTRVDAALKPLSRWIVLETLLNVPAVLLLGSFLGDHIGEPRFAVPAALLLACAVAILSAGIRQWVALRTLDYGTPILAIQKRLAAVRVGRIRTTKWILIVSPLLWTPLLIVAIKGLVGVDPYAFLDAKWLAANLLFGLAFLALMLWVSKRYGDRWKQSPAMQRFLDNLAGRSLASATGFLNTLSRFEQGEAP